MAIQTHLRVGEHGNNPYSALNRKKHPVESNSIEAPQKSIKRLKSMNNKHRKGLMGMDSGTFVVLGLLVLAGFWIMSIASAPIFGFDWKQSVRGTPLQIVQPAIEYVEIQSATEYTLPLGFLALVVGAAVIYFSKR